MRQGLLCRVYVLGIGLGLILLFAGCGGGAGGGGGGGGRSADSTSNAALSITTTSLPTGVVGTAYSVALGASGGTAPYSWSLASGSSLPGGLSLAGSTIAGTPKADGATKITVQVQDSSSPVQSQTQALSITIDSSSLSITTTSLAGGTVGVPYSASLEASGGTAPYTWSLVSGSSLPAGLRLAGSTISGTPASAGTTNFTVQINDSSSPVQTRTQGLSIAINAGSSASVSITTPSTSAASVTVSGSLNIVASVSGVANTALNWTVSGSNGGTITTGASPYNSVTYNAPAALPGGNNPVTITATSQVDNTKSASLTVTINPSTNSANAINVPVGSSATGINFDLSSNASLSLALANLGGCVVGQSSTTCEASVTGIAVSRSGLATGTCPNATCTMWLLGRGLTDAAGDATAAGLTVGVTHGGTVDVTVKSVTPRVPAAQRILPVRRVQPCRTLRSKLSCPGPRNSGTEILW